MIANLFKITLRKLGLISNKYVPQSQNYKTDLVFLPMKNGENLYFCSYFQSNNMWKDVMKQDELTRKERATASVRQRRQCENFAANFIMLPVIKMRAPVDQLQVVLALLAEPVVLLEPTNAHLDRKDRRDTRDNLVPILQENPFKKCQIFQEWTENPALLANPEPVPVPLVAAMKDSPQHRPVVGNGNNSFH